MSIISRGMVREICQGQDVDQVIRFLARLTRIGVLEIMAAPIVYIISPYRGSDENERDRYRKHVRLCTRQCLALGEIPFAPHDYYTRYLDDDNPEERAHGLLCGHAMLSRCDVAAVYDDYGLSEGMIADLKLAVKLGKDIQHRRVFKRGPRLPLRGEDPDGSDSEHGGSGPGDPGTVAEGDTPPSI